MTAQEEAEQLFSSFLSINLVQVNGLVDGIRIRLAKKSAEIACDKLIDYAKLHGFIGMSEHYIEVKNEIEKL